MKHPYISRKKGTCGGKPIIAGTRIKVEQVAIVYERMGWTADQIIQAHPHLSLAEVHDALSYYYENIGRSMRTFVRVSGSLLKCVSSIRGL
jgi:uncharacterized protein (DUF433 family)